MRFSYIDSQGKEIEVDSVESLALRIELGAIEPDTRMYDAVADRWAPAEEHPVFRSLSRGEELTEDDIVPIGSDEDEPETAAEGPTEGAGDDDDEDDASGDPLGLDFEVSMAADEVETSPDEETDSPDLGEREPVETMEDEEGFDFEEFDADSLPLEEEEDEAEGPTGEAGPSPEDTDPGAPDTAAGEDDLWDAADEVPTDTDAVEPGADAEGPTPGGPAAAPEEEADGNLPPWAREAPAWDDEEGVEAPVPTGPESPATPDDGPGAETPQRPEEAVRPAHWEERRKQDQRKEKLQKIGLASAALAVVAVGGAYVAGVGVFPGLSSRTGSVEEAPLVPQLPSPLRATLDAAGDEAWARAVSRAASDEMIAELPQEPPREWLDGIYLSTASDFPGVQEYWRGMEAVASAIRARARYAFPGALRRSLGAADDIDGEVERLLEVGLQEFDLSTPRRQDALREILAVSDAALALHEFLLSREDEIAYEPYSSPGVSRDPVLEAVPESEGLRQVMNARLDRVLEAIAESGIPRPVTTRSTLERLTERLEEAGWRHRPDAGG